jgi:mRNA interferase MazF
VITEGQIVLFRFPQTDQQPGKLRPALVIRKLPGRQEDWPIKRIEQARQGALLIRGVSRCI